MGKAKRKTHERKNKINLVFDEDKRKDFLCGFRKRKLERKKKAQEELNRMLKEEKKRIKQENLESYKKLVVSSRPIPDIDQLLQEEYEDENVNVKVVELSSDTLKKKNLWLGDNSLSESVQPVKKREKVKLKKTNEIQGMGSEDESEVEESEDEENASEDKTKTKKEIKKILKHQATKKLQKSKAFQMKNRQERIKNKKKSLHKAQSQGKIKKNSKKEKSKKSFGRRKH